MPLYKPTADEKRIIRACAQRSAGYRGVEINPSTKIDAGGRIEMNIALLTDDPKWRDVDLFDNAYQWRDFTKGVPLAEGGRAIVDFYVYNRGRDAELKTNITIWIEDGRLARVDGTCNGTMWRR